MKNKLILSIILGIFLLSFATASPLEDILSDEATGLSITITPNETITEFYLDTSSFEWDKQDIIISYMGEEFTLNNVPFSVFLLGFDFKVDMDDLRQAYSETSSITIDCDNIWTTAIFNLLTSVLDIDFECELINENSEEFISELKEFIPVESIEGDSYIEKNGINYKMVIDKGFGDIPEEYNSNIEEILSQQIHVLNLQEFMELEDVTFNIPILDELDFELSVDLDDLIFYNGNYEILAEVTEDGEIYSKVIYLTIEGMEEQEYDYVPEQEQIRERIREIKGLELGNNVQITFMSLSETTIPSNTNWLQLMNITLDYSQQAEIQFAVETNKITDKNKVSLYIYDGSWNKLSTTYLGKSNESYIYSATAPHFSLFLIAEDTLTTSTNTGGGSSHSHDEDEDEDEVVLEKVCEDGEVWCVGEKLYTCLNEHWDLTKECELGCDGSECVERGTIIIEPKENEEVRIAKIFFSLVLVVVLIIIIISVVSKKFKSKKIEEVEDTSKGCDENDRT